MTEAKIPWSDVLTSVQPRIRLTRSFDQRSHTYQGYLLRVQGTPSSRKTVRYAISSSQRVP